MRDYSKVQFCAGEIVVRWRDITEEEWIDIGEVETPPIGEPIKVLSNTGINSHGIPTIELDTYGYIYPATAFVLQSDYNYFTQTNGGTAALNNKGYGKDYNNSQAIEVQGFTPSIISGPRISGSRIQGRRNAAAIRRGHLSHSERIGK